MKNPISSVLAFIPLFFVAAGCASVVAMDGGTIDDHETTVSKCGVGNYTFRHLKDGCGSKSDAAVAKTTAPAAASTKMTPATSETAPVAKLQNGKIEISKQITFKTGSAKLTNDGMSILDEVASIIRANGGQITKVNIEGHTDQVGDPEKNMALSEARAKSVKAYLAKKGVPNTKLESKGYGSTAPKFNPASSTKAETALNRRVEFTVETIRD